VNELNELTPDTVLKSDYFLTKNKSHTVNFETSYVSHFRLTTCYKHFEWSDHQTFLVDPGKVNILAEIKSLTIHN